jgi:hypothetical protein
MQGAMLESSKSGAIGHESNIRRLLMLDRHQSYLMRQIDVP